MPCLAALHIPIGVLQQPQDDVLDIFADVAGFRQGRGVHDRERHVQDARQRLRQQRLAGSRRPDQQDVGLRQLHFGAALLVHLDALVVVVDRHRQLPLGGFLTDHVLVQILLHFQRLGELMGRPVRLIVPVVLENRIADGDAFVANVRARIIARGGNQLADNVLAFMTEGTTEGIVRTSTLHASTPWYRTTMGGLANGIVAAMCISQL